MDKRDGHNDSRSYWAIDRALLFMCGFVVENGHLKVSIRHLWTIIMGQMNLELTGPLTGKLQKWSNACNNVLK